MRRKNSEHFKREILRKGMELMWLKGFNGTSVKDIVDEAGIPKGSFYNYFESKEGFAIEALQTFVNRAKNEAEPIMNDESLTPLGKLKKYLDRRIEIFTDELEMKKGCFASNIAQELADVNDKLGRYAHQAFEELKRPVILWIQESIDMGELSEDNDAEELADFIENVFRGAMIEVRASKSEKTLQVARKYIFEKLLV